VWDENKALTEPLVEVFNKDNLEISFRMSET
jgi:hypothetical protein